MSMTVAGRFSLGRKTANAGTAITQLIPPWSGRQAPAAGGFSPYYTHISKLIYTTGATAHDVVIMRPFNYTTLAADAAASQAVVVLAADPGSYSTAYQYPTPSSAAVRTANNLIAGSDYVVLQLPDGTYLMDTVSSVSTLSVTLANNLPTGGAKSGAILWFFGVAANSDPATGRANPSVDILASETLRTFSDSGAGLWASLHPGDPLIVYSANGSNAGSLELVSGFYASY